MGEYIALSGFDSASSSNSDISVFDRRTSRRGDYSRLHSGVGADRYLTSKAAGKGITLSSGLGSGHLETFAGQLGQGIAQSIDWFPERNKYYRTLPAELKNKSFEEKQRLIKPYGEPWNKVTKKKYPEHWKLVNPRAGQKRIAAKRRKSANLARGEPPKYGLTLPFSNNIGPGNSISIALTRSDLVAQGHDLHYQQAKKPSDVLSADREAINHFAYEAVSGSDPISQLQAGAGFVGLGVKHIVESAIGKPLYSGKLCHEFVHLVLLPMIGLIGEL